jgi:hypothetical protein
VTDSDLKELNRELRAQEREISTLLRNLSTLGQQYSLVRQRLLDKHGRDNSVREWVFEMDNELTRHGVVTAKAEEEAASAHSSGFSNDRDIQERRLKFYNERNKQLIASLELHAAFLEDTIV